MTPRLTSFAAVGTISITDLPADKEESVLRDTVKLIEDDIPYFASRYMSLLREMGRAEQERRLSK